MFQNNKKNEKTPNTFVDGVPVKISEQYKPPRKITLPFSCQNSTPSEVLYSEYDFRLENIVMNKLMEWKKMRQEIIEKRKERLKAAEHVCQDLEKLHNLTLEDNKDKGAESGKHLLNPKLGDSILTPICAKANSMSNKPASSLFNLSDFESDNSSPFDNMELKTINDMEVLASILTSDNMKQSCNNNYNIIDKELNKNGFALNKTYEWGQAPHNSNNNAAISNYNESVMPENYHIIEDRCDPLNSNSENFQLYNYELNDFPNQCDAGISSLPTTSGRHSDNHPKGNQFKEKNCVFDLSSKSVPDIVNELQKELAESKERVTTIKKVIAASAHKQGGQKLPEPSGFGKKSYRKLSDPTAGLMPNLLNLALHISEMGFPLPRVARACKFFDGDHKKIIEFLLQVQTLEEQNYPSDLAERALHINNFRIEETKKFLSSMMILLDLGFEEEKVEEALKKTNSDRDKALDMLIS